MNDVEVQKKNNESNLKKQQQVVIESWDQNGSNVIKLSLPDEKISRP